MTLTLQRDFISSSMPVELYPITQQNLHQAAQVLARAFVDDPVSIAVYPKFSFARRIEALTADFTAEVSLSIRKGCPIIAQIGNEVVGAAVIYPPGGYPFSKIDQWKLLLTSLLRNGLYNIRDWMSWLSEVDQHHPAEPHFYLEYIGVDPHHQGKGLGSMLLLHLVEMADARQLGCYLENANPRNTGLYQRFGFEVFAGKEIVGVPTWFMWRQPKGNI